MATEQINKELESFDNNSGSFQELYQKGTYSHKQKKQVLRGKYDFSISGGAIGTINLLDESGKALDMPKNAVITSAMIDVVTAFTSGGSATIALNANSAGDLKTATAVASYSTGIKACTPVGTAATAIKLTADRKLGMAIAVAALTAGKAYVLVEFFVSES